MQTLEFKISIKASKQHVWETMLHPVTYKQWVMKSWPDSSYEGTWAKDQEIRFVSSTGAGTLARIIEYKPYDLILANHIAIINAGGSLDKDSDMAKGWIGTKEQYTFTTKGDETLLTVTIAANPQWIAMFNEGWPEALTALKEICEKTEVLAP